MCPNIVPVPLWLEHMILCAAVNSDPWLNITPEHSYTTTLTLTTSLLNQMVGKKTSFTMWQRRCSQPSQRLSFHTIQTRNSETRTRRRLPGKKSLDSREWFQFIDLSVMSPALSHCTTLLLAQKHIPENSFVPAMLILKMSYNPKFVVFTLSLSLSLSLSLCVSVCLSLSLSVSLFARSL